VSWGQLRLLLDREPLDAAVIARLAPAERAALEAVREGLAAGDGIGLAPSGSYRSLLDRGDAPLVTVVVVAPPDRVEPVSWWFPIVGSVPYRGYFDPARAERFAERMAGRGLDTHVRPALLYSTLGWFDDPLPRAILQLDRIDVLDVVVHERVHETVFVADDVAYNEGLATFVAESAVLAQLGGAPELAAEARRRFADRRRFGELIDRLAAELEALYAAANGNDAGRETARRAVFERYRAVEYARVAWETARYAGFAQAPLSNAYVVAQRTYLGDLPCFERELAALAGDLREFVARHVREPGRHDGNGCAGVLP
jgi:predicted aminopeptidase